MLRFSICLLQVLSNLAFLLGLGQGIAAFTSLGWMEKLRSYEDPSFLLVDSRYFILKSVAALTHHLFTLVCPLAYSKLKAFHLPFSSWGLMFCVLETSLCYSHFMGQGRPYEMHTASKYPHTEDTFRYLNFEVALCLATLYAQTSKIRPWLSSESQSNN